MKAGVRKRVQNAGWWYPSVEDRSELLPLLPRALTTTNQYGSPQSIDTPMEDAQLIDVAGDSMVLVVAGDHTPKPYTDLAGAIMLTALKLGLDGFVLGFQQRTDAVRFLEAFKERLAKFGLELHLDKNPADRVRALRGPGAEAAWGRETVTGASWYQSAF